MKNVQEKRFYNSKELLDVCIEQVHKKQKGVVGGNVALYPTVIVMLGEKSKAHIQDIKNTLDDNWNNSHFLKYLCFVKEDNHWHSWVLTEDKEKRKSDWETIEGNKEEIFSEAILEMLQQEKIFKDKSSIKMEFIMDSSEEEGSSYYDLYLKIKHGLLHEELKTFYLMLDQNPNRGKSQTSEKMLRYLLEKQKNEKNDCGTIYILSNYLRSGAFLGENRIWENYRLVADIILLGGNQDELAKQKYASNLYNGIKTASYFLLKKPTDKIAVVSLQNLLEKMYQREAEHYMKELSQDEIKNRLGINVTQEFEEAEKIFKKKILKRLPRVEDLQYLPFSSEEEWKRLQKKPQDIETFADNCMKGVWSLFVQEKYVGKVEQYLANEEELQELAKELQELLYTRFSFFEILNMSSQEKALKQMLMEELRFKGITNAMDYKEQLHEKALYECKKDFYKKLKEILVKEFEHMLKLAKEYKELYESCIKELEQEKILFGEEKEDSINKFYGNIVDDYVEKHQNNNSIKSAFPNVFDIRLEKEALLFRFWKVFTDLIQQEVYEYDFEKELEVRMSDMSEERQLVFVKEELQMNLEGGTRLRTLMTISNKSSKFYLVNHRAKYAKYLEALDKDSKDFMLFNLNRTDCIEQIEIYNITKPENLYVNYGEKNNDN